MPSIKDFKTIIKPIITEKSSLGAEFNQVTFQVNKTSNKKEIKTAIENIFKVKVKKVNTSIVKVNCLRSLLSSNHFKNNIRF